MQDWEPRAGAAGFSLRGRPRVLKHAARNSVFRIPEDRIVDEGVVHPCCRLSGSGRHRIIVMRLPEQAFHG